MLLMRSETLVLHNRLSSRSVRWIADICTKVERGEIQPHLLKDIQIGCNRCPLADMLSFDHAFADSCHPKDSPWKECLVCSRDRS